MLLRAGVPFDVAFSADAELRAAWCIMQGQHEGREYDFNSGRWIDRD